MVLDLLLFMWRWSVLVILGFLIGIQIDKKRLSMLTLKKVLRWQSRVVYSECFFFAALTLIGLGLLELKPAALILSLVVGQVGFILDRLRHK